MYRLKSQIAELEKHFLQNRRWLRDVMVMWHHDVVVVTTAQLHSTKPELRFGAGSNPPRGVSEFGNGENL